MIIRCLADSCPSMNHVSSRCPGPGCCSPMLDGGTMPAEAHLTGVFEGVEEVGINLHLDRCRNDFAHCPYLAWTLSRGIKGGGLPW